MIKRPHKYTGECVDCTDKDDCRYGTDCPFIDNENRLKTHHHKGLVVRYLYGCSHYRAIEDIERMAKEWEPWEEKNDE